MEKGYQLQQWVFVERLGGGGMAEVWKARHTRLDEFAAVKFLLPSFAGNSEVQDRFLREGRSQFILRHSHIVRSSDFITQDNCHFLVMEYIHGRSLYTLAMDEGPLAVDRVVRIAVPLLDALSYAHEKGIVHRDVKLQNILLDENDKPYLTDFGIAKALRHQDGSGRGKTGTSMLMGSVECMSPEQIQHPADIDHRSDLYSFGCVLYDLLTGQPPFVPEEGSESDFEIMRRHVFEPPKPLRELNPEIPESIQAVVLRALAKDRNQRFASCRDMALALEGRASPAPQPAPPPPMPPTVPPPPSTESGNSGKTSPELPEPGPAKPPGPIPPAEQPRRRSLATLVAVLLVVLLAFTGFKLYDSWRPADQPQPQPQPQPPPDPLPPQPPPPDPNPGPPPSPPPIPGGDESGNSGGGTQQSELQRIAQLRQSANQRLQFQRQQAGGLPDFEQTALRQEESVRRLIQSVDALELSSARNEVDAGQLEKEADQISAAPRRDLSGQHAKAQQQFDAIRGRDEQNRRPAQTATDDLLVQQQTLEQLLKNLAAADMNARELLKQTEGMQQEFQAAGVDLKDQLGQSVSLVQNIRSTLAAYNDQQQRVSPLLQRIARKIETLTTQRERTRIQIERTAIAIARAGSTLIALDKATPPPPPPSPGPPVPPQGRFRWQLDLREGQTALIRFKKDGETEYMSAGRLLPGAQGLRGVQADIRLSSDRFEVTQPLLPSTGFSQLELKCRRGRCNETLEITWTRN